jgi:hypothetical protein
MDERQFGCEAPIGTVEARRLVEQSADARFAVSTMDLAVAFELSSCQ